MKESKEQLRKDLRIDDIIKGLSQRRGQASIGITPSVGFHEIKVDGRPSKTSDICVVCKVKPVRTKKTDFCSRECFLESKRVAYACPANCGKLVTNLKCFSYRACSQECELKLNPVVSSNESELTKLPCSVCKKEFKLQVKRLETTRAKYCSQECFAVGKQSIGKGPATGNFISTKAGQQRYDSFYEFCRMKELDNDKAVVTWDRCKRIIPWTDAEGNEHNHSPVFEIEYSDGSIVIEEARGRLTDSDVHKTTASRKLLQSQGIIYRILNDKDELPIVKHSFEAYKNDYGLFSRPSLEYVFMSLANQLSERSTCLRNHVGVVITNKEMSQAYCLGYNGGAKGMANQCDSLLPGKCNCIHAEINAIAKSTNDLQDCMMFTTVSPCVVCAKVIVNKGLKRVIYLNSYRDSLGREILRNAGIEVISWDDLCDQFDEKLMPIYGPDHA